MPSATFALQQSIFTALTADSALTTLLGGARSGADTMHHRHPDHSRVDPPDLTPLLRR